MQEEKMKADGVWQGVKTKDKRRARARRHYYEKRIQELQAELKKMNQ